jgi:hypothetical protein
MQQVSAGVRRLWRLDEFGARQGVLAAFESRVRRDLCGLEVEHRQFRRRERSKAWSVIAEQQLHNAKLAASGGVWVSWDASAAERVRRAQHARSKFRREGGSVFRTASTRIQFSR